MLVDGEVIDSLQGSGGAPLRLFESRPGAVNYLGEFGEGPVQGGTEYRFHVPGAVEGAGVSLNWVALNAAGGGFISAYPCEVSPRTTLPTSTLNYGTDEAQGGARANGVLMRTGIDGDICFQIDGAGNQVANVIADGQLLNDPNFITGLDPTDVPPPQLPDTVTFIEGEGEVIPDELIDVSCSYIVVPPPAGVSNPVYDLRTRRRLEFMQGALDPDPQVHPTVSYGGAVTATLENVQFAGENRPITTYGLITADERGAAVTGFEIPEVYYNPADRNARVNDIQTHGYSGLLRIVIYSGFFQGGEEIGRATYSFDDSDCESVPATS